MQSNKFRPTKPLSQLRADLSHADPRVRADAAEGIRLLGPEEAPKDVVPELVKNFIHEDELVRTRAAEAAVPYGQHLVPVLLDGVKSPEPRMRMSCFKALGLLDDETKAASIEQTGPLIWKALEEEETEVRREAAFALNRYMGYFPERLTLVMEAIKKNNDKFTRVYLIDAIASIPRDAKDALPFLDELVKNESDPQIKSASIMAASYIRERHGLTPKEVEQPTGPPPGWVPGQPPPSPAQQPRPPRKQ